MDKRQEANKSAKLRGQEAYPPYPGLRQSSVRAYSSLGKQLGQPRRLRSLLEPKLPRLDGVPVYLSRMTFGIALLLLVLVSSSLEAVVEVRSSFDQVQHSKSLH